LQRLFRVKAENVIAAPDAQAAYPYRVVLGADFDSCVRPSGNIITIVPTASPCGVPPSEATLHAAAVLQPPPKIDGDLTEWANLPYPLAEPILGPTDWEGPPDL